MSVIGHLKVQKIPKNPYKIYKNDSNNILEPSFASGFNKGRFKFTNDYSRAPEFTTEKKCWVQKMFQDYNLMGGFEKHEFPKHICFALIREI